jgi:hypothetical protein
MASSAASVSEPRGGVDHEVGRDHLPRPIDSLASDAGDAAAVCRRYELEDATTAADHDVATRQHTSSDRVLEQRPRGGVEDPAEIAAGKGVEPGQLFTEVGAHSNGHGPGGGKIAIEARENSAKRLQAAREETMQLARLRRARSMRRMIGQPVPFQHDHLLEMVRQRTSGREAAHAGSDHHGLPAQNVRHRLLSRSAKEFAKSLAEAADSMSSMFQALFVDRGNWFQM